jgi:hypothetical protein
MMFPDSGAHTSNTGQSMRISHNIHAVFAWLKSSISHAWSLDPEWILAYFRIVHRSIANAAFLL